MSEQKYKEFWISQGEKRGRDFVASHGETRLFIGIHTIEIQALLDLQEKYAKLVEALKNTSVREIKGCVRIDSHSYFEIKLALAALEQEKV